jgi:hypothetical protein
LLSLYEQEFPGVVRACVVLILFLPCEITYPPPKDTFDLSKKSTTLIIIEVQLKLVLAMTFSLITFLGVMSQASNACARSLSLEQVYSSISATPDQTEVSQANDLNEHTEHDSGCHHGASTCRNCHLGHCAFTIGTSVQIAILIPGQILDFATLTVAFFDFQSSPFRPPIA